LWECRVKSVTGDAVHIWQQYILSHKLSGITFLLVIHSRWEGNLSESCNWHQAVSVCVFSFQGKWQVKTPSCTFQ
jgi:hypothetical protein